MKTKINPPLPKFKIIMTPRTKTILKITHHSDRWYSIKNVVVDRKSYRIISDSCVIGIPYREAKRDLNQYVKLAKLDFPLNPGALEIVRGW